MRRREGEGELAARVPLPGEGTGSEFRTSGTPGAEFIAVPVLLVGVRRALDTMTQYTIFVYLFYVSDYGN